VICADREWLDSSAVSAVADALAAAQVARIAAAITRVRARHPSLRTAVVTGVGAFLGAAAAAAAGMVIEPLAATLGDAAARCAPAVSVALLLAQALDAGTPAPGSRFHTPGLGFQAPASSPQAPVGVSSRNLPEPVARSQKPALVDTVVKLGGGVLSHAEHFERALATIAAAAREHPLLVVPGGGPFADAVRDVDRRCGLSDVAAHWMAVLAMDQYAHLVAARLAGAVLVEDRADIAAALRARRVPVLVPSRWLRAADPLPHSWDVTSDSLAAWIAGAVGARRLLLIKPAGASGDMVDAYFARTLPASVTSVIVAADQVEAMEAALADPSRS
jgi:aspartokinase-like uncharacterized kinase